MGTCGLVGFRNHGVRVGIYNPYHSMPEILGRSLVRFILELTAEQEREMVERISTLEHVDGSNIPSGEDIQYYQKCDITVLGDNTQWSHLLNSFRGVDALESILTGKMKHIIDDVDLLGEVDWAYFIDFSELEVEIWRMGELFVSVSFDELDPNPGAERKRLMLLRLT